MVKSNRYTPTNKKFKSHFENFASEKVKKGHLGKGERDSEDTSIKEGTLVKIDRKKMYSNGWIVKIDKKEVNCTYNGNVVSIPESTVTDNYFIPKKTCSVEVQLDTVSKIYAITKIKDSDLTPIALYDNQVTISPNTNTNTNKDNKASITVSRTGVNIAGDITAGFLNAETITVDGEIKSSNITTLEKQVADLQQQIQDLKGDTNNAG